MDPSKPISNDAMSTKDSEPSNRGLSSSASGEGNDRFANPPARLLPSSSNYSQSATRDADPPPYSSVVQQDSSFYVHRSTPYIGWDQQSHELTSPFTSETDSSPIPWAPIGSEPRSTTRGNAVSSVGKSCSTPENEGAITSQPSRYRASNNRAERSRSASRREEWLCEERSNYNCIGEICGACCIGFCGCIGTCFDRCDECRGN